jgi:metal-responsive CopG/Arc/MetJ family transcriptional regulator
MAKKEKSNVSGTSKTAQVSIPAPLAEQIEKICKETGFDSVSEYVTYVLEQVLLNNKQEKKQVYSEEEKKKVTNRLKGLGYLD